MSEGRATGDAYDPGIHDVRKADVQASRCVGRAHISRGHQHHRLTSQQAKCIAIVIAFCLAIGISFAPEVFRHQRFHRFAFFGEGTYNCDFKVIATRQRT